MIILDTNVFSEIGKSVRSPAVIAWTANVPAEDAYVTTVTRSEVPATRNVGDFVATGVTDVNPWERQD